MAGDSEEARLFLEAMRRLDAVPDKDRPAAGGKPRRPERLPRQRSRRLRPDESLDLHGKTAEEARAALEAFVAAAAAAGSRTVRVVTGRGAHSPGGVAVLKRVLEEWLAGHAAGRVRAFAEAPRHLGGRGATILYLR